MNFHINSQKFTHFLLIRLSCVRDTHIIFMRIDQANWVRESLKWNCLDLAKKHFWAPLNWMLHTHTHINLLRTMMMYSFFRFMAKRQRYRDEKFVVKPEKILTRIQAKTKAWKFHWQTYIADLLCCYIHM